MHQSNGRPLRFMNPIAPAMYLIIIAIPVPIVALISFFLRIHEYWGWPVLAVPPIFTFFLALLAGSVSIFTSVEIGGSYVILRAPLLKRTIHSWEVSSVELKPPVNTLSMDWGWWKHSSVCTIHRKVSDPNRAAAHKEHPLLVTEYRYSEQPIDVTTMPDGLKRRIAQALDPANWPPLPEE